jgi:hypothetical protein
MTEDNTSPDPRNRNKLDLLRRGWAELLRQALRQGFFGTAAIEVNIEGGMIQYIRRNIDRTYK